jgi:hypothetical protein
VNGNWSKRRAYGPHTAIFESKNAQNRVIITGIRLFNDEKAAKFQVVNEKGTTRR